MEHEHDEASGSHAHEAHEHAHTHGHAHDAGADAAHGHDGHTHAHPHVHDPAEKKRQVNRCARIIGHLGHVKKMLEDDVDCAEVLVQLSAVRSALNGLGVEIIDEHLTHCITHAIEDGDMTTVKEFEKAIRQYV